MHRPPTNGMNEALGQTSGNHDSTNRGLETTSANRIISKRKIQELVESIDPSERLETEVEDVCHFLNFYPFPSYSRVLSSDQILIFLHCSDSSSCCWNWPMNLSILLPDSLVN